MQSTKMLSSTGVVPFGPGTHPFSNTLSHTLSHPPIFSFNASPTFQCLPQSSYRMAAAHPPSPSSSSMIYADLLSAELIALVCEHLRESDYNSLLALRLASSRFNAIATPVIYQTLELNEALVRPDFGERNPRAQRHISLYTKTVIVRSNLNPAGIRHIISSASRLKSIRWKYEKGRMRFADLWLPSDLLDPEQIQANNVKLHIEGLPLRDFEGDVPDAYLRAVPATCLATLQLASPVPPLAARLSSLKHLLVESHNLETFHYRDRGQGTSFQFKGQEKLPAFTNLVLESYDWNHSGDDVAAHWDFSKLQSLRLISVPVFNFLRSVPVSAFSKLHTLQLDDYSAHLPDKRADATRSLYTLIRHHIDALEHLELTCHIELFDLDAISRHAGSLRSLRLRDHVGFGDEHSRCPTISAESLSALGKQSPYLHTLELDMDWKRCDPARFLLSLSAFRSLHTLTLHVQTVLSPFEPLDANHDEDYDATMKIYRLLTDQRESTNPHLPWKRITVNVGGWRRVMVRRVSTTWRERNEMGIYAERCFVLEREDNSRYNVWEETGYESPQAVRSPEP